MRQAGGRLPPLAFVRAQLREYWTRLPEYFKTARPTPGPSPPPVADHGYLRLATPDGIIYRRVSLWDEARVVDPHRRY